MAKAKITNIKLHIKHINETMTEMLARNNKHENGLRLAPIDVSHFNEIRFYGEAILRVHDAKKTRKDIRI